MLNSLTLVVMSTKGKALWLGRKEHFLLLPRQCTYFCLASQMALLEFIFIEREREKISLWKFLPPYAAARIRTHVSRTCTTLWDLNSGPLYQLSYRDRELKIASKVFSTISCLTKSDWYERPSQISIENLIRLLTCNTITPKIPCIES